MSAFVVEDKTINRVVDWLHADSLGRRKAAKYALNGTGRHELTYDLTATGEAERLAVDMFNLNVAGVNARYGPNEAQKFRPLDFKFELGGFAGDSAIANACRALKSLQCWQYQCSEGDIPDTPLFKMFNEVEHAIADWIIGTMPEYEQADWA